MTDSGPRLREQFYSRYYGYLDRTIPSVMNERVTSDSHAVEFAKLLTQSLIILHGGGLIAIPAYLLILNLKEADHRLAIGLVFVLLVFGLVCAFFAGIMGFFALAGRADGHTKQVESIHHDASVSAYEFEPEPHSDELKKLIDAAKRLGARADQETASFSRRYQRLRGLGIVLIIFSLVSFVSAAGVGLFMLQPPAGS